MVQENKSNHLNNDYILEVPNHFEPERRGMGYFLFNNMKKHSDRIAQYIVDTDEEDSFESLLQRSIRTSIGIKSRNLTKDDVIILCSHNHKNSCVPFVASIFLGIPVASLDLSFSALDVKHLFSEVKPRMLFVTSEALPVIEESMEGLDLNCEIVVFEGSSKYTNFSEFVLPHEEEKTFLPREVTNLKETVIILFSSGTTGFPKGIMLSHYGVMGQCNTWVKSGNFGSVLLSYSSLYWITTVLMISTSARLGSARLICSTFRAKEVWRTIEKYRVATLFLAPNFIIDMVKEGRPDNLDTTSLLVCFTAGSSLAEEYMTDLSNLLPGTYVFQMYGQTEITGCATMFKVSDANDRLLIPKKLRSAGTLIAGVKAKVVNPETEEVCGPNQQGELRIKSEFVMNGYYKRDSSESFDADGWLRTGDILYFDEDYCFFVTDRIKEMLKYKNWHVSPAVIENILLTHPAIQRAAVIGIPNVEDGDHPMAVVSLDQNYKKSITVTDLIDFVHDTVPDRMKLRGGLKIVDKIPSTPSGKIRKKDVKDMVLKGEI